MERGRYELQVIKKAEPEDGRKKEVKIANEAARQAWR